ncbi:MAG: DNA polymerase IV [Eubacteriales bacterium]|nr:DNA polymerase IV [Eubacteriales bacterium]MDD3863210.1 DNA polymerase IV [Eubacteriales bacterium]MDD4445992.1 DNA polymerase IV [Eubacteriales bacterium]
MARWILHCDMNSFFASVELLDYPSLRDRPVAVGGNPKDRRGIILAKNEAAKKYGIKTAETIWSAKQKCPQLVLLPPHHDKYEEYCGRINSIYLRYTDLVEPFSIDESWLDVTGSLEHFGKSAVQLADDIRQVVKEETGLTLSAGVSFNKIFAKMGSEYKKPDATTLIDPTNYRDILWPMPVRELFFVGAVTAEKLHRMNILTIGDLARSDPEFLALSLGKHGSQLYAYANGLEDSPVARYQDHRAYKSVGNGITFKRNLVGIEDVRTAVNALSDRVAGRLRSQGLRCGGVKLDIKDPDFRVITRQLQLARPTDLGSEIRRAAMDLIEKNWQFGDPIRLLTVTAINLTDDKSDEQLSFDLLTPRPEAQDRAVEETLDSIRKKFGRYAVVYGGLLGNDLGISDGRRDEIEYEER